MMVKCINNIVDEIGKTEELHHVRRYVKSQELNLEIGKNYQVFGIGFWDGVPWYLINEEEYEDYPKPYCFSFFEVTDPNIPGNWCFCPEKTNAGSMALLPEKWARDPAFLEKLVDDDRVAVEYFRKLKKTYSLPKKSST